MTLPASYWANQIRADLERRRKELCPCGVPRENCKQDHEEEK